MAARRELPCRPRARNVSRMATKRRSRADDLDRIEQAARNHGLLSNPDHEVGDLLTVLRAVWPRLSPTDRRARMREWFVVRLLETWENPD